MKKPLVTVIVPIYNVAAYLRRCLDSLKNQSLKEIEVIMIDDGSTDESGSIAEEYCSDVRFRVIHIENSGLCAARNLGIQNATTEWLMFVDSDDWVDSDYCIIPYNAAKSNNADLVVFGYNLANKKGNITRKNKNVSNGLVDEFAIYDFGEADVWNKLYHRDLFRDIKYPEGRVYEELATTHKIVHMAKRIMLLNDRLYYYCNDRKGSIVNTISKINNIDWAKSVYNRYQDMLSYGYDKEKLWKTACSNSITIVSKFRPCNKNFYVWAKNTLDLIDKTPKCFNKKKKVLFVLWKRNRWLFYRVCKITGRLL